MTTRLLLAIFAFMFLNSTSGGAAEPPAQGVNARVIDELANVLNMRREAAMREYEARVAEFKSGRVPANVALQSNQRSLHSSLATASPNAAVKYDLRAAEIEAIAWKNLEIGNGTRRDVEKAKSARLDAMLKNLLVHPGSGND